MHALTLPLFDGGQRSASSRACAAWLHGLHGVDAVCWFRLIYRRIRLNVAAGWTPTVVAGVDAVQRVVAAGVGVTR